MMLNSSKRAIIPILLLCSLLSSCAAPTRKAPVDAGPLAVHRQNVYHTVAPGETLWRISQMYAVAPDTIQRVNRITDANSVNIGTRLYIPGAVPRRHVITLYPNRKWKYIIIHHSGTETGSSQMFNEAHIRRGWGGIGYHFVIDNGTAGKDDGQIETSPRWIQQLDGAHCKASSMNEKGIGICLVGNFSNGRPSRAQMDSLVYLVNTLREYYGIPKSRILGHGDVPGANTECPGTRFPWHKFMARLK